MIPKVVHQRIAELEKVHLVEDGYQVPIEAKRVSAPRPRCSAPQKLREGISHTLVGDVTANVQLAGVVRVQQPSSPV